ncbi:MAG: hypothetical protein ACE5FO_14175, partial [Parvularculaceae bacterium]
KGVKSLYYCRSKSVQRAGFANGKKAGAEAATALAAAGGAPAGAGASAGAEGVAAQAEGDIEKMMRAAARTDYDECLACQ